MNDRNKIIAAGGGPMEVRFSRLPHCYSLPTYATSGSAGMDLYAAHDFWVPRLATCLVSCGFMVAIPEGYEAQIRPRSGLAYRHDITVLNSPGTIDSDYRGEVKVLLVNHSEEPFEVEQGVRIAQMVITPVIRAEVVEVGELDGTDRGDGGFGSTGV